MRWIHFLTLFLGLSIFGTGYAGPKTLIKYKGGKIKPGLAKTYKKLADTKYEFDFSGAKVGGKAVTAAMVKSSLEAKGLTVAAKGATAVIVSANGTEKSFLKKVSRARIKAGGSKLALESSVSQGGMRAKTAERDPAGNEIRGQVISVSGDVIKLSVTGTGKAAPANSVKNGQVISVSGKGGFNTKRKETIFFKPVSSNPWKGTDFKKK